MTTTKDIFGESDLTKTGTNLGMTLVSVVNFSYKENEVLTFMGWH